MSASLSRLQPSEHSSGSSELSVVCMEANQMPPVEKQFCDSQGCEKAPLDGAFLWVLVRSGDLGHVRCLWPFLSLDNFELDFIALSERLEAGSANRAEMHEYIRSSLTRDEAEPLGVVEPFNRTSDACH